MAPRKTNDEQHDEFRQTLENFTHGLQEALQLAVQNALTTVLQTQQGNRRERRGEFDEEDDDAGVDNLFAIPVRHERDQQIRVRENNVINNNNNNTPRWES